MCYAVWMEGTQLFLALFTSVLGMAYTVYGKKQSQPAFFISGLILMFIGYFVDSVWLTLAIFIVLAAVPFWFRN